MFFKSCLINVFTVNIFVFIIRSEKKLIVILLFKKLIYEKQPALIHNVGVNYVDNRFGETKTRPWRHITTTSGFQETKKPRHWDCKTKKPWHQHSGAKTPRYQKMEATKPRYLNSKAFFQRRKRHDIKIPRLKNHDIQIPRPKSHDIEFLWNSNPYAPW